MYRTDALNNRAFPAFGATTIAPSDPRPLAISEDRRLQWAGPAISLALFVGLLVQLRSITLPHVGALFLATPTFWLAFVAYYCAPVAFEWLIFRRLWRIPVAGLSALIRKYVGNEILLGYIGEAQFYLWARKRTLMTAAPFGAIKDVAILSAVVGNAVTLAMIIGAYPLLRELVPGAGAQLVDLSVLVVLLSSLAAFLLRRRLFSLATLELKIIAALHLLRMLVMTALAALMWHLAMPSVALGWWLVLASLRLLLSRLPFLPNKDVAFAGLAILAVGHDSQLAQMLAILGALIMAAHVAVGLAVTAPDFLRRSALS
jgi:hypothetical protein